jgi:ubiquinone/menaquinone biosynthesis C-methylase UbiE
MRYFMIGLLLSGAATTISGQVAVDANKRYQTPEGRAAVATGLNDPHRDDHQKPKELIAALGIKPGMAVADIGTGTGYMLPFLHDAVGEKGHVYGEDIFDDFLAQARARIAGKGYDNVTFVKGTEHTASLVEGSVNLVLVLDVYHHFNYPTDMLDSISRSLKRNGRLAIVDYYKRPGAMASGDAVQHIRIDYDDMVKEVEANGFHLLEKKEQIPNSQYLAIFGKGAAKH